jgi:hypothetical protein
MPGIHPIRFIVGCVILTGLLALVGGAALAVSGGRTIWYVLGSGTGIMSTTATSFSDGMTDAKAENDKQAKARAKAQADAKKS